MIGFFYYDDRRLRHAWKVHDLQKLHYIDSHDNIDYYLKSNKINCKLTYYKYVSEDHLLIFYLSNFDNLDNIIYFDVKYQLDRTVQFNYSDYDLLLECFKIAFTKFFENDIKLF